MQSRPCILLVDYQPHSIVRARKLLEGVGFDVRVASDGIDALKVYEQLRPDLVLILEAMIPKKHGFEVCREIKKLSQGRVPVIVASAVHKGTRSRMEALRDNGCDEFIERPVSDEQILSAVRKLLAGTPSSNDADLDIDQRLEEIFRAASSRSSHPPSSSVDPLGGPLEGNGAGTVRSAPVEPTVEAFIEQKIAVETAEFPRHSRPWIWRQRLILLASACIATAVLVLFGLLLMRSGSTSAPTPSDSSIAPAGPRETPTQRPGETIKQPSANPHPGDSRPRAGS